MWLARDRCRDRGRHASEKARESEEDGGAARRDTAGARCAHGRSARLRVRIDRARPDAPLAGFRNVLVHDYATVDVRRVHAGVGRLEDFEAFVADVEGWLARGHR
jgi:hypothetical protein